MDRVKTLEIETAILLQYKFNKNLIVPNITAQMGLLSFETDMLCLSSSGYATGFEIKVSKSDLRNDLKKHHIKNLNNVVDGKSGLERYYKKFKYFYYAVPEFLVSDTIELVPEFCGIYSYEKHKTEKYFVLVEKRKPVKLFDYKWSDSERYDVARLGAMRIYTLKRRILEIENVCDSLMGRD